MQRWTYYRLRTEGHNCLVLNGANQDDTAEAPIINFASRTERSFAVADLSAAYSQEARRVWRGIAMLNGSRVLIQDEIVCDNPVDIVWGFHTSANIGIDGDTATLTQDKVHLAIHIVEPENAAFRIVSARPPEPQKQNDGIANLTIELSVESGGTRIVVEMIPYRDKLPSLDAIQVTSLADWK